MHPFQRFVNPHLGKMIEQLKMDKRFVRGEGCYLFDDEGTRYLDFIAAYGALPFGFNPQSIWSAVMDLRESMEPSLIQPSNLDAAGELAQRLIALTPAGLDFVTYTNSGAEAVEAAIKMARSATGRRGVLTTHNSFHGKTLGALSATGKPDYQTPFGAPAPGFDYIPFGDPAALARVLEDDPERYAAFIVEPIQGEGGIIIPPEGYLQEALALCRKAGTLLVLDEVQTGLGRTGRMFAFEEEGITPDIMVLAKALGGGLVPIGAVLSSEEVYTEDFGLKHSSTFAGNSLACRVGMAALDLLTEREGELLGHVSRVGARLLEKLGRIEAEHGDIIAVRGRGLMIGVDFLVDRDTFPGTLLGVMAEQEMLTPVISSYLLNTERLRVAPTLNGKSTIRIEPALVVTDEQCDYAAECLERTAAALATGNTAYILRHLTGTPKERITARATAVSGKPMPTPTGDPAEGRFAFLVHPVSISNYAEFDESLSVFTADELSDLTSRWNDMVKPFVVSSTRIHADSGATAYGEFIAIARTADEMLELPREQVLAEVSEAIELARDRGAGVVGLGAYTAVVTYGGLRVQNLGVPVTTGNCYTVVSAVDAVNHALERLGIDPGQSTAAVVGASGAIGRGTTMLLAESIGRMLLIGNPAHPERSLRRLEKVAADICRHLVAEHAAGRQFGDGTLGGAVIDSGPPAADADEEQFILFARTLLERADAMSAGTDIRSMLPLAEVVITATSNVDELVTPDMVRDGAVICDISRPPNVSREVHRARRDVLVIDGGVIALPGRPSLGWNFGFGRGLAYACMAETMMMGLEHHYEHASIGSNLPLSFILHTRELADKHGFSIAELRSFDRPLRQAEWEAVVKARSSLLRSGA